MARRLLPKPKLISSRSLSGSTSPISLFTPKKMRSRSPSSVGSSKMASSASEKQRGRTRTGEDGLLTRYSPPRSTLQRPYLINSKTLETRHALHEEVTGLREERGDLSWLVNGISLRVLFVSMFLFVMKTRVPQAKSFIKPSLHSLGCNVFSIMTKRAYSTL